MDRSGLTKEEIAGIRVVLLKYEQVEEAVLFGSRAMGTQKPASGIDFTLKGKEIDLTLQTRIEFDLDDLMLPYKFDISVYDKLSNPELLDHIERVGRKLYKRKEKGKKVE